VYHSEIDNKIRSEIKPNKRTLKSKKDNAKEIIKQRKRRDFTGYLFNNKINNPFVSFLLGLLLGINRLS
jgi:hypothetical protein